MPEMVPRGKEPVGAKVLPAQEDRADGVSEAESKTEGGDGELQWAVDRLCDAFGKASLLHSSSAGGHDVERALDDRGRQGPQDDFDDVVDVDPRDGLFPASNGPGGADAGKRQQGSKVPAFLGKNTTEAQHDDAAGAGVCRVFPFDAETC